MEDHVTARLKALRLRAGLSREALAKACEYKGGSSYQRYEDPTLFPDDSLPPKLVAKLEKALVGLGTPPITAQEVMALGYFGDIPPGPPDTMPVLGLVGAGHFTGEDEVAQEPTEFISFGRDVRYPLQRQYAREVRGESANKILPNGSYAICVENTGQSPRNGEFVIALRRARGIIERTVKRYVETPDHIELQPLSTDPSYKPIILNGAPPEDTTYEIEAFVIGVYRKL